MQPKLRLVPLILAAGLLILPASAAAATKSASVTAASNLAVASATAKCPRGQRATGGGFTAPAFSGPFPQIRVYESRKVGQRSWRASGQIADPGATSKAFTLTARVYCRADAPTTKSKSASLTATSEAIFTADAKCESSGRAHAGGFLGPPPFSPGGGFSQVIDSYRTDKKTWRSRILSEAAVGIFTSYVYCADEKKPAARTGSTTSSTSGTLHTALSAECKRGTKPVAGGFSQPDAVASTPYFTLFYESFKSGKRVQVSAPHFGSTSTLNSIAYCG